ncbi:D-alanyl-D-alanine carboxypeptidase/D-alanyl-D-alanine-endopeptidase [Planctomycetota bacterium]
MNRAARSGRGLICTSFLLMLLSASLLFGDVGGEIRKISSSSHLKESRFSLAVYDVKRAVYIHAVNRDTALVPASNQKLLVTAAAMLELGPDFKFHTQLYIDGPIHEGVLNGSLYLRGGGDPNLSGRFNDDNIYTPVDAWVKAVQKAGIRKINGDILVDDSIFDRQFFHPSWPAKQAHHWYAAEIGALALNDGCIDLTVKPGKEGEAAAWSFQPFTSWIRFQNTCRTVAGKDSRQIRIGRQGNRVLLAGRIGVRSSGYFTHIAIHDPGLFTGAVFGRRLAQQRIGARAIRRTVDSPKYKELTRILDYTTQDLQTTLTVTNARSQNLYAEMLLKYLGHHRFGQGSFKSGIEAVTDILEDRGFDFEGITMDDGGGLSHQNRISTARIVKLLELMYVSKYRNNFVATMAKPADAFGTLRKRLKGVKLKGQVYGKTGYISGAKALSGYVVRDDGHVFIFSFLANKYKSSAGINDLQNKLMTALANSSYNP